ncbi:hypothetical protein MPH_02343 [Macrophomina phaseolina MS6]|uniref:Uncharacterized protein n=1 Tax=Macrophomina phaseolina (strain MS6) TaxID=1126212 RepID=K2SD49_MACPH|nr:hypothetical protein MPH_02343 [Macrophomina phaseolina MS6]
MLCTSGWRNLNSTSNHAVYVAKMPRKTIKMRPGTMPTTARDDGNDSIPLDTISAIMRTATSGQESVLYLIWIIFVVRGVTEQHPVWIFPKSRIGTCEDLTGILHYASASVKAYLMAFFIAEDVRFVVRQGQGTIGGLLLLRSLVGIIRVVFPVH